MLGVLCLLLSVDFLYWEGLERGLDYALKTSVEEPRFDFTPAFRVRAAAQLPQWNLECSYTRFYSHSERETTGPLQSVWTEALTLSPPWQNAKAKWALHSNIFDFLLGQKICLSPTIVFEPSFGIKWALLQQWYKVRYMNLPFLAKIPMKNRSWNLGPAFSSDWRWNFASHFDFIGLFSASILASDFTTAQASFWALRPQAALSLGLSWKNERYELSASYETQVWWKQNMLFRAIDQTSSAMISPTQGNLFFHGLTLEGAVNF